MANELIWIHRTVRMMFLCSFLHFASLFGHDLLDTDADPHSPNDLLNDYVRHSYTYDQEEYDDLGFPLDDRREKDEDDEDEDVSPVEFVYDRRFPSRFLPIDRRGRFDLLNPVLGPEGAPFVEGDMVFSEEEGAAAAEEDGGRKLPSEEELLWPPHPGTGFPFVPFVVHSSAEKIRPFLEKAIRSWEKRTCITFKELPSEIEHNFLGTQKRHLGPYLEFVRSSGCWSYVGRQYRRWGGQKLSIGRGCTKLGTVLHEIGHALGLLHEQSRSDRDEHVKILWKNVMHGKQKNFRVWKDSRFDEVPYDYSSVMHYGSYFFGQGGRPTLLPRNPFHQHLLGQRDGFSFRDIAVANSVYGCIKRWEASCGASTPKCENGGYVFRDCRCLCPPGTAGPSCAAVTGDYYPQLKCGGNVTSSQIISSPRYPQPFPANSWCMWWARAPRPCQRVRLVVGAFELLRGVGGVCHWDLLEVRLRDPLEAGDVYCGADLSPGQELVSEGRDMFIVFRGRYGFVSGFSARLDFVEGERAGSEGGEESAGVMGDEAESGPTGEGRGTDGGNSLFN
ncbi:blastula protease 10-like isoform X2 [Penaeus monodon]|uniref:blastula protease 10-like isoform X2 n=1 Tax=Penaeus monodon TaxID=6687 RepID=UPI0018A74EB6|nr:blastula protease 10-like isoform X2 [Penaeus monodon]